MLISDASSHAPTAEAVMARAAGENFPVASRVLPRRVRAHLLAVYGYARLVDELGDRVGDVADRLAALDWLESELDRAFAGEAEHPLLVRLQHTLSECALPREPFARLIEANRLDQRVSRHATWTQLREYCALSADPVGELVLGVFDLATPARVALSDSICTALQLTEHCQDVAEDLARGRVYLPAEDLRRFGCSATDLSADHASELLREVLAFEVARARGLLADGLPLIAELRGRPKLAVAAFAAGGSAALDAIERVRFDVLAGPPRATRQRRAAALIVMLWRARQSARVSSSARQPAVSLDDAYRRCEAITRRQAANFFYGIGLLSRERRRAMCAVYAFARRIDDIGDGALEREEKLRRLEREARTLAAIAPGGARPALGDAGTSAGGAGASPDNSGVHEHDAVIVALADAHRRFSLPPDALGELIEGVRMDVGGVTYERFDELVVYCRRVAGAIGRACLAIFGVREDARADMPRAQALADDLGVALQLTNILRDLREDAVSGRVYLPAEDLRRFGVLPERGASVAAGQRVGGGDELHTTADAAAILLAALEDPLQAERLAALVRFEARRARAWFDRGLTLTHMLDRRSAACALAMAGIYRRLLMRIEAHPQEAARRRTSLPAHEKAWVAVRGVLGVGV